MASKSSVRTSPGTEQKAKDLRWEAIEAVRAQDGILGTKHFDVQDKLGRRNFGIVHLCELKGTKCYFAMKCIAKASCAVPERLLRAQTEKEILQSVDHLFLPTLYAHIETEKYYRLVMEFCPGGDLHTLQEKQPGKCFPEQAVKFYAAEVLLAMEYLHMLGIIYCDLNLQNALVRDDGHIMLSNFDLSLLCAVNPMLLKSPPLEIDVLKKSSVYCTQPAACIEPSRVQPSFVRLTEVGNKVSPLPELIAEPTSSRSMSYFGSHEYLAPEIIKDKGHTSAVDWWTFGIFLYELLFGKTPFKGSEYQETLANVVGQPLWFPESPAVSIQAKDLIRGLLVKEPQHRLAFQQGATEIKQHPFFKGVNWDLIRFASPPEIPSPAEFERLHRPLPATSSSSQKGKTINQSHAKNLTSTTVHKFTDIMLSVESANNVKASSAAANKASNVSSNSNVLKPPPSVPAPGLTPLKPTPEKAEPCSPERPASSRRAPSIGGPPHPLPTHPEEAPPPPPGPPPPPPPPRGRKSGPKALPPSKGGITPSRSSPSLAVKGDSSVNQKDDTKAKLKPFYWEKIRAKVNHSMVWDRLEDGSFRYNEEMIESLFGYAPTENKDNKKESSSSSLNTGSQFINFIDQRKTLNLLILLKSLNVTKEKVCEALLEGKGLPSMLLETLLKMAPTKEQESKLRLFDGEISQLGRAEQFLKALVDIPFAFKRLEILLFRDTFQEEANSVKEAFITLEAACKELRNSRLFLKLLEAVLKTGNRMNDGTRHGDAQAFKLDALLKMADIKGTDHKTTLLHFVVQEIIHSEGVRAVRADRSSTESEDHLKDVPDDSNEHHRSHGLQVVSGLGDQLNNVKKAACLDYNGVLKSLLKLGDALHSAKNFPNNEMTEVVRDNGFRQVLEGFVQHIEGDIMQLLEEEKRITGLLIKTARYFHINYAKEEGLRLFGIVRDFLIMLDKVCLELKKQDQMTNARQTFTETPFEN